MLERQLADLTQHKDEELRDIQKALKKGMIGEEE
jgi:hypothetical protein